MHKLILRLALLLILALPAAASAQEPQTTPEPDAETTAAAVPVLDAYYNSAGRFGMPLPPGWENVSEGAVAHFSNGQSDMYVLQTADTDVGQGIGSALRQINPEWDAAPTSTIDISLPNGTWKQEIFQLADGTDISAYGQVYDNRAFVIALVERRPEMDTLAVIVEASDTRAGLQTALTTYLPENVAQSAQPQSTQQVDTPAGQSATQTIYALPDGNELMAQAVTRGELTYVTLESGPAEQLVAFNDVFFTVLLGFFVTPDTSTYLTLGLAVVAVVVIGFVASIWLRHRGIQRDLQTLDQLGNG